jgi:hypothetical protein
MESFFLTLDSALQQLVSGSVISNLFVETLAGVTSGIILLAAKLFIDGRAKLGAVCLATAVFLVALIYYSVNRALPMRAAEPATITAPAQPSPNPSQTSNGCDQRDPTCVPRD